MKTRTLLCCSNGNTFIIIHVLFLILTRAAKISEMLSMYDQVDKLVEPTPSSNKYSAPVGTQPPPDTNPYNAWSVLCSDLV